MFIIHTTLELFQQKKEQKIPLKVGFLNFAARWFNRHIPRGCDIFWGIVLRKPNISTHVKPTQPGMQKPHHFVHIN
jgi:hypothetical protein